MIEGWLPQILGRLVYSNLCKLGVSGKKDLRIAPLKMKY